MLLRLAYLGVTNAFALLRLLPMSDQDEDVEILVRSKAVVVDLPSELDHHRLSCVDRSRG